MAFPTLAARALAPAAAIALIVAPAPAATGDLAKVEAHLNAAQSMTANFVQTDSKNRQLTGILSLKRPGRIRFEYGRGANMLLVGNGKTLTFVDYEVGQKSSWAIAKSPLSVLLSGNPNLERIARVLPSEPSILVVRARDARRPEFGTLILGFIRSPAAPGGLILQGWTAIDAQNKRTKVLLSNQRYNVAVPESAFTYREPTKR
ncbi:outer membrane lipoprotein carrier protein LolA [Sphingomonas sp. HDW15A]|uniref:LolA family protein n=1 Tax=Sphingomonas sp. HDW15A TaxID=2714942 RepID=UPI0014096E1A|nr:outer membrane lipoprotein carrier protein LolA [Sphingomonas sp. HDW15A]QIK96950.1 outer membrane lipoprotein carrier protein LolA [Sphingomonas sp. HDW15A]